MHWAFTGRRSVSFKTTGRFQRESHVAAVSQGGRTMLTNGTQYFLLNEIGTRIWELLEQPRSLTQIVHVIGTEYDSPVETIQRDTEDLLKSLVRHKLVKTL